MRGDGRLLEKVFTNVLGNAAAYSGEGAVITVSLKNGVSVLRIRMPA